MILKERFQTNKTNKLIQILVLRLPHSKIELLYLLLFISKPLGRQIKAGKIIIILKKNKIRTCRYDMFTTVATFKMQNDTWLDDVSLSSCFVSISKLSFGCVKLVVASSGIVIWMSRIPILFKSRRLRVSSALKLNFEENTFSSFYRSLLYKI